MAPPTPRLSTSDTTSAPAARATEAVASVEPSSTTSTRTPGASRRTSPTTTPTEACSLYAGSTTSTSGPGSTATRQLPGSVGERRARGVPGPTPAPDGGWLLVPPLGGLPAAVPFGPVAEVPLADRAQPGPHPVDLHGGQDGQADLERRPVAGVAEGEGHGDHDVEADGQKRADRHPPPAEHHDAPDPEREEAVVHAEADEGPVVGARLDQRVEVDLVERVEEAEASPEAGRLDCQEPVLVGPDEAEGVGLRLGGLDRLVGPPVERRAQGAGVGPVADEAPRVRLVAVGRGERDPEP